MKTLTTTKFFWGTYDEGSSLGGVEQGEPTECTSFYQASRAACEYGDLCKQSGNTVEMVKSEAGVITQLKVTKPADPMYWPKIIEARAVTSNR